MTKRKGRGMSKPTVLMIGAYPEWDMPSLEQAYDLRKLWLAADKEAFLAEAAPDVRAIATRGELGASGALIDRCPKLESSPATASASTRSTRKGARARGVRVTNTPDVLTEDVADFAFALILAHMRKVVAGDAHVRSGAWAHRRPASSAQASGARRSAFSASGASAGRSRGAPRVRA